MKINVLSLAAVSVLMTVIASCSIDDITQNITEKSIVKKENTRLTSFIADRSLNKTDTRTSLDHGSGYFFWENGDKVYVKDDDNIFQKSNNVVIDKTSLFNFMMPGTYTASKYIVYYPGKGGYGNRVTIAAEQIQGLPITANISGNQVTVLWDSQQRLGADNSFFSWNTKQLIFVSCLMRNKNVSILISQQSR